MPPSVTQSTGANYRESFTYDRQGNITGMQRWGLLQTHVFGQVDNVTFSYRGNQLLSANETLPNQNLADLMEFKKNTSTTYSYDTNGRLTTDLNKKISSITYNWLHLPSYGNYQDGNRVAYTYQASGVKLQTKYYSTGSSTPVTRDYAANKVYENNALKMILTEDGYITKESGAYKYHYYLRDHLGSNRVTIDQAGNVVQMANYYPFGALQAEKPSRGDQAKQPYLYNGKELDRQYGLDALDYGARIYDPVAGRFGTMDPMAEKYYSISPYAYCANNPVNRIDPTGEDYWSTNDPEQIRRFMESAQSGNKSFDFTGWNHATDAEFTANLTYNDQTRMYHSSYGTIEDGVVTAVSVSFKADINPVTQIGGGQPVREPISGFWGNLGYYALGIGSTYTDINGGVWNVNKAGNITGLAPIAGIAPTPSKSPIINLKNTSSYSKATYESFKRILQKDGKKALLKSKMKIEKKLLEHENKIESINQSGGFGSSVEREIRTFKSQLAAINDLLN